MEENLTRPVPDTGRLDLKNDYVFKRIFAKPENNTELKELTEAILNEKIKTSRWDFSRDFVDIYGDAGICS